MKEGHINLYSDTQTRPSPQMLRAMVEAKVGDEQADLDPSVNRLCEQVAAMLGKEAAVFLPSGTMCNQIAIAVHCRGGDEILASDNAHIIGSEGAGAAIFAGSFIRAVPSKNGIFDAKNLHSMLRTPKDKAPCSYKNT